MKLQVEPEHYRRNIYDTKERFIGYWHQIDEILSLKPRKLLEVGVGNGFVSDYLTKAGLDVITLDVDKQLPTDSVGSVMQIPFSDRTFDMVSCFEVLEHLPYENFYPALREMGRVSSLYVILSLPDCTTVYRIYIELPIIKTIQKLIPHPFYRVPEHQFKGQHYWEIGKKGFRLSRIKADMVRAGFSVLKAYRIFEFQYNHIFLLKKT